VSDGDERASLLLKGMKYQTESIFGDESLDSSEEVLKFFLTSTKKSKI